MPPVMWPILVDMSKEESFQYLRHLELEAYSHLVSALRAQGSLSSDKKKLLKETSALLNITQERHNAEIRRALSDEKLNTIAYHVTGHSEFIDDWAQEGRRLVPLIPRMAAQTAYSTIADEVADTANHVNKQLPSPSSNDHKRGINLTNNLLTDKSFRIPEPPKLEDSKKRKLSFSDGSSCLAQHLLGPSKTSRIQQLYRQRTKSKSKDQYQFKVKEDMATPKTQFPNPTHPKINVLQNISLQPPSSPSEEFTEAEVKPELTTVPVIANENQAPRNKILTNIKPANVTLKQIPCAIPGSSSEATKTVKMCPKKTLGKPVSGGQKLIVVSNAQTIPTSSILQRTLSIPFVKNISVKNFEKFKIVTSTPNLQGSSANNNVNSVKHKVVTVRTNPTTKKVIPLSQLQVLNSKGNIKVLPLGGKIVGKTVTSTTSSPLYIMNTMGNVQTFTKSLSTPVIVSTKSQEGTCPSTTIKTEEEAEPPVIEDDVVIKTEEPELPEADKNGVQPDEKAQVEVEHNVPEDFKEEKPDLDAISAMETTVTQVEEYENPETDVN